MQCPGFGETEAVVEDPEDNTDNTTPDETFDDEDVDDELREPFHEESHSNGLNLRIAYSKFTTDDTVCKVSQTAIVARNSAFVNGRARLDS